MGQPSTDHPGQIRTVQIITFALMQGVVVFGFVAFFISRGKPDVEGGFFVWIALGFAIVAVIVRSILSGFLTGALRNGLDRTVWDELSSEKQNLRLIGQFQTKHIVECAVLELAAIFNLFAYMAERNIVSIFVAGMLLLFMAISFPGGSKIDQWVDNQKQLINLRTS